MRIHLSTSIALILLAHSALPIHGDEIEVLDAFRVEETNLARRLQYCEVSGFQILSVFTPEQTRKIASAIQKQDAILSLIVPRILRAPADRLPDTIFMDEQEPLSSNPRLERGIIRISRNVSTDGPGVVGMSIGAMRGKAGPITGFRSPPSNFISTDEYDLQSSDHRTFYRNIWGIDNEYHRFQLEENTALSNFFPHSSLVLGRVPRWPDWLEEQIGRLGIQGLFADCQFGPSEIRISPPQIAVPPPVSLTVESAFADDQLRRQTFIPLFMWWALIDGNSERVVSFWHFAEEASRSPPNGAMFGRCFGKEQWSQFINFWTIHWSKSSRSNIPSRRFYTSKMPIFKEPIVRNATRAESVRIRSEYEWRMGRELSAGNHAPLMAAECIEQAGRRLRYTYADGERDPQFLAVLALFECDAGTPAIAKQRILEAAATGVHRPQIYLELARIRLAEARATLNQSGERLPIEAIAGVLRALDIARKQHPALLGGFYLRADTWSACGQLPNKAELDIFREALEMFPRDSLLALKVASLFARVGLTKETGMIAQQGLLWTGEDFNLRNEITKLKDDALSHGAENQRPGP
jgi:hypothetical protein